MSSSYGIDAGDLQANHVGARATISYEVGTAILTVTGEVTQIAHMKAGTAIEFKDVSAAQLPTDPYALPNQTARAFILPYNAPVEVHL